jgi:hypothetical protein
MKKNNDILHELVQSLTKAEKRFISLHSQSESKEKIYLKIFKVIEKQKDYDEDELLSFFSGNDKKNQLGFAKNYLQNLILKNLRFFHSDLKANITCKNLLIEIEILFWKGQYKLAEKTILKTKKIAQKYEIFSVLEELNYWKIRIHNALVKIDKTTRTTTQTDSREYINKYLNILEYKELINTAQLLIKESEVIRDGSEKKTYLTLLNNPLLKDISSAQSNEAKYNQYVLNSVLYNIIGEHEKSEKYRTDLLNFLESNPHLIEENPIHYIAALHNILNHHLITHDYDNFNIYLKKLKDYNFNMPHERANVFSALCLFELGYYLERRDYKNAIQFIEETVVKYENVTNLINPEHKVILNHHAVLAYYHSQQFNKALKWVNKVLIVNNKGLRLDIKASSYVLNILTHYELNNLELLPYLSKSTITFLKSSKMLKKADEIFLSIFYNTSLLNNQKEKNEFLIKKKHELQQCKVNSIIKIDINYVDWISSKLK